MQIYERWLLYAAYQPVDWPGTQGYGCVEVERIVNGPEVGDPGIDTVYWKKKS